MLRFGVFCLPFLLVGLPAAAVEDSAWTRSASNPIMTRGAAGSIDFLKIGPRAMLREGPTTWKMWYEAPPSGNKSYTALATSSDGISWTKYAGNPVMSPSEAWEGGAGNATGEVSPTGILREHGLYKLWYHGFSGTFTRQVGYATSPDGVSWTKHAGNPVLTPGNAGAWDADSVCEPRVLHIGSTYYMYYTHCYGSENDIGLATSTDGLSWTKYAGNPVVAKGSGWEDKTVAWGNVYHDGVLFHMWYLGIANAATGGYELGYASSSDGKTFTKSATNPVLARPQPLIVNTDYAVNKGDGIGVENSINAFRLGNVWRFYYGGFASCCPEDATLCMATAAVKTSPNRAPLVDAGADQVIVLGQSAALSGIIQDDDVPVPLAQVMAQWSKLSGPGTVTFSNAAALGTTAMFSAAGTYVLQLVGNDTALSTTSQLTVSVLTTAPADLSVSLDGSNGGSDGGGGSNDGGGDDLASTSKSPGGCGCGVGGQGPSVGAALALLAMLVLFRVRNKQR